MLKVNCKGCGSPYEVDPRRVPKGGLKMRCPACDTTFVVAPDGGVTSEPEAAPAAAAPGMDNDPFGGDAPSLGGLDLDLPAPKRGGFDSDDLFADLPAPKGAAPAAEEEELTVANMDLDADLPGLKPPAGAKAAPEAPGGAFDLGADLPGLKSAANAPDLDADLPGLKAPAGAKLTPDFPGSDFDLDADLPGLKAPAGAKLTPDFPGGDLDADLPGLKAPAGGKLSPDFPGGDFDLDADLPGLKAPAGAKLTPDFPGGDLDADLPGLKGGGADLPGLKGGNADLPAAKTTGQGPRRSFARPGGKSRTPDSMPRDSLAIDPEPFGGAGGLGALDELDGGSDLPGLKGGNVDLPGLKGGGTDLPAVKGGNVDLPGLKGGGTDLPAVKGGNVDLPGLKGGGTDLPAVKGGMDLPAVKPGENLISQLNSGSLELDAPAVTHARSPLGNMPKDSLDMDAAPLGGADLGSPFELDDGLGAEAPDAAAGPPSAPAGALGQSMDGLRLPTFGDSDGLEQLPDSGPPAAEGLDLSTDAAPAGGDLLDLDSDGGGLELDGGLSLDEAPAEEIAPLDLDEELSTSSAPPPILELAPERRGLGGGTMDLDPGDLVAASGVPGAPQPPSVPRDDDPFADLAAGGSADAPLDAGSFGDIGSGATDADGRGGLGGVSFGEVDLGLGGDAPPPPMGDTGGGGFGEAGGLDDFGGAGTGPGLGIDRAGGDGKLTGGRTSHVGSELSLDGLEGASYQEAETSSKFHIPGWAIALSIVVAFVAVGAGMGQTKYGLFGIYLVERFLPEAGDPQVVAGQIADAEKVASVDTYTAARKAVRMLAEARDAAGLNRRLLARSLMHEALYQLRFGNDNQSSQRSVAILARVMERGEDAPGLSLARAADAARRGDLQEAHSLLATVSDDPSDPYIAFTRGTIALQANKLGDAQKAFAQAAKAGAGARAHWGSARALLRTGDAKSLAAAKAEVAATLAASPTHVSALTQSGEWAMAEGKLKEAEQLLRKATGWTPIDGQRARASRDERARAWMLLGKVAERRDHLNDALVAYEHSQKANPMLVESLLGSGRALLHLSRPREALAGFQAALGATPSAAPNADGEVPLVQAKVGAARALLRLEKPDEAVKQLLSVDAANSEAADLNLWLGHAYQAQTDNKAAEARFRKAIAKAPNDFSGYLALAQLLFEAKRPEEAAQILEEARSKVEDGPDVRRMLGQSELARNHISQALDQFVAALEFDADHPGALYGLGIAQRRMGELEAALESFEHVARLDPKFPGLALEHGRIYEAQGDYEKAVTTYSEALEHRDGDLDLQLALGAALVSANKIDQADEILQKVIKARPTSAVAEHFIGRVLFAREDTAQAIVHLERAVNLDPAQAQYHMYLGWAALDAGNFAGALESVTNAIERDETLGDAHWVQGRIQLRMGSVKDALESFHTALKLSPGRHEALADMGDAYDQLRELKSAIAAYEAALEKDPERGEWWYRLGRLRLDRGKEKDAMQALSKAIVFGDRLEDKPGWLADAHRIYGDALRLGGKKSQAIDHYQLYLELAPRKALDRADVEDALKRLKR